MTGAHRLFASVITSSNCSRRFAARAQLQNATEQLEQRLLMDAETTSVNLETVDAPDSGPAATFRKLVRGDFNGDGREDIAVWMSNRDWQIGIAGENGEFTYTTWTAWAGNEVKEIHVGDFNNDGKDDIIGLFRNGDRGRWWVALSDGSKFVNRHWGDYGNYEGIHSVLVGNFDGVKGEDLAVIANSGVVWMAKTSNTRFQYLEALRWNLSNGFEFAQVGNFNGDSRDDIVAVFGTGAQRVIRVAKSIGPAAGFYSSKWADLTVTQSLDSVLVGDFDGDGRSNIAVLLNGTRLWCGRSNGQTFTMEHWLNWSAIADGFESISIEDSNSDGLADVVARLSNGMRYSAQSTGTGFVHRNLSQLSTITDGFDFDEYSDIEIVEFLNGLIPW